MGGKEAMNPIPSISNEATPARQVLNPQPAAAQQPAAASASSAVAVSSSVNVTMVHTQVDAMLGAIGGGVQDNKMLRMMIALLILQALLTNDQEQQDAAMAGLLDMLGMSSGKRPTQMISLHSATDVVQIQQQSTVLATNQAALSPTATEGDPRDPGSQIDLSA
jgi:hypothetical protein